METLQTSISAASLRHKKGCSCLQAWSAFQAEVQQGTFNDVNEVGTSARKKFKKQLQAVSPPGWKTNVAHLKKDHPEIDNPYALTWWQKNKGEKSHLSSAMIPEDKRDKARMKIKRMRELY